LGCRRDRDVAAILYWPKIRLGFRKVLVSQGLCKWALEVAEYMDGGAGVGSGVWLALGLRNWRLGLDLGAVRGVVYALCRWQTIYSANRILEPLMPSQNVSDEPVRRHLRRRKIFTIEQLAERLDASKRTAQRRLHEWRALSSLNHNARYYALPEVPDFDSHGLWRCRQVLFSQYGTLARTVVALVTQSPHGLSAVELGERLGMNGHSFLSGLAAHPELHRDKFGGRFVYFAAEATRRAEQQRARRALAPKALLPRAPAAVAILVERIKHPELDAEALAARVRRGGHPVEADHVRALFEHHGLVEKKGARLPRSGV